MAKERIRLPKFEPIIYDKLAVRLKRSRRDIEEVLDELGCILQQRLIRGDQVRIYQVGTIKPIRRKRTSRNRFGDYTVDRLCLKFITSSTMTKIYKDKEQ